MLGKVFPSDDDSNNDPGVPFPNGKGWARAVTEHGRFTRWTRIRFTLSKSGDSAYVASDDRPRRLILRRKAHADIGTERVLMMFLHGDRAKPALLSCPVACRFDNDARVLRLPRLLMRFD